MDDFEAPDGPLVRIEVTVASAVTPKRFVLADALSAVGIEFAQIFTYEEVIDLRGGRFIVWLDYSSSSAAEVISRFDKFVVSFERWLRFQKNSVKLQWIAHDEPLTGPGGRPFDTERLPLLQSVATDSVPIGKTKLRKMDRRIAWVYPGGIKQIASTVKPLMLFFDGIADLGVPWDLETPFEQSGWLVEPLAEAGLFHLIDARTIFSDAHPGLEELPDMGAYTGWQLIRGDILRGESYYPGLDEWVEKGEAIDKREKRGRTAADIALALMLNGTRLTNGVTVVPVARSTKASKLFLREQGFVGTRDDKVKQRLQILSETVFSDLAVTVGNLDQVPIGEILDFRAQNLDLFQNYIKHLHRFVELHARESRSLSAKVVRERREEILDEKADIELRLKDAWRTWIVRALLLGAGALSLTEHSIAGALLNAGMGAFTPPVRPANDVWSTFLVRAKCDLSHV